jgi:6-phosphogluconate dehydrogenase
MKIAIHGLGRMGMQIAKKLAAAGHTVIAHNRSPEPIAEAASAGAMSAATKQDVLAGFGTDRVIVWLMLPADVTESELVAWLEIVPEGSLIIDGGNSDFRNTKEHAKLAAAKSVEFLDIGTSGGIMGMEKGFCMMAGGSATGYETLRPVLDTLALPSGAHEYFGAPGTGHYVKMVHHAIEYGMMESLAEGFRILKEGAYDNAADPTVGSIDLAKAAAVWQHGSVITSTLNGLTAQALQENPTLEGIEGFVAENGETRWTLEVAASRGIPMPSIQASMDVRLASQKSHGAGRNFTTKLLAAMRAKFGGHALNKQD